MYFVNQYCDSKLAKRLMAKMESAFIRLSAFSVDQPLKIHSSSKDPKRLTLINDLVSITNFACLTTLRPSCFYI